MSGAQPVPAGHTFELRLYEGRRESGDPVYSVSAEAEHWIDYVRVRAAGFDGSVSIDLSSLWLAAADAMGAHLEVEVEGLETISKFGESKQLRTPYLAVLDVDPTA